MRLRQSRISFGLFILSLTWGLKLVAAVPTLDSFLPTEGIPGTPVQISGTGLATTTDVLIGTEPAVFQILSDRLILATVPREASTGTIQIVTTNGIAVSNTPFIAAPFIEEFNPEFGAPNDAVILFGRNLGNATAVHFGDTPAAFTILGETQIRAVVPNTTGLHPIRVTTPVGEHETETDFEAVGFAPFVNEFRPEMGSPGTTVTVEGQNFLGTNRFLFDDVPAAFFVTADTQMQVTIPPNAPSGPVTLTNARGTSISRVTFLVLGTTPFLTEFVPDIGSPGELITLEGINFTGTTGVRFGDVAAAFTVTSDTQMQITVPEGATSGPIQFESLAGEATSEPEFTVSEGEPLIEDFSPLAARVGEPVRINGRNFSTVTAVVIGETPAEFTVVASTQISLTVPPDAESGQIVVTNPAGIATSETDLVIIGPEPVINELDPNAGLPGDSILIEGGNLATVTNVMFGSFQAEFAILADNQLQAIVPRTAVTDFVSVDNPGGRDTSESLFFLPARIESFEPTAATPGERITVRGAGFTGITEITFNSIPGTIIETTPESVEVEVPEGARIGPIAATNPAGISATQASFGVIPVLDQVQPPLGPRGATIRLIGRGFSEIDSVRFGAITADFEILSASEIEAIVPLTATDAVITLANPTGSTTSAEIFQVQQAADLALSLQILPEALTWLEPYTFDIAVLNRGPSTASNLRLTIPLPTGSQVTSLFNPLGASSVEANVATCTLLSLAPETVAVINLVVVPQAYTQFESVVSLQTELLDPNPADNQRAIQINIDGPDPTLQTRRNEEGTLLLEWPVAAADFVLQATQSLATPLQWETVSPTPPLVNGFRSLPLPIDTADQQFYRLLRPEPETPEPNTP